MILILQVIQLFPSYLPFLHWKLDITADNPNGIRTLSANGFNTFFLKARLVFSNGPKSLPKNPSDCPVLCKCLFDNFV